MPRFETHERPRPGFRYELMLNEQPRRAFSSVNVRFEDKEIFDILQAHLCASRGKTLHQWDVFGVILADWLEAHEAALPATLSRGGARAVPPSPRR